MKFVKAITNFASYVIFLGLPRNNRFEINIHGWCCSIASCAYGWIKL